MYQKILLATDGSELAMRAVEHGLALAKTVGATTVAVCVVKPVDVLAPVEMSVAISEDELRKGAEATARHAVDQVRKLADEMGVPCETRQPDDVRPWHAITETAKADGCDLIVMGSHGRTGFVGLVLGSETQKVLAHSSIPVLVHR